MNIDFGTMVHRIFKSSFPYMLIMALIICLSSSALAETRTVRIGAFNSYPTLFKDNHGEVQGFLVDVFKEIEENEHITFEYIYATWPECLDMIKNGDIDLLPITAYSPERAQFLDYGKNHFMTLWGEVYTTKSSDITGIKDIRNKTIAIVKNDINAQGFQEMVHTFKFTCNYIEVSDYDAVFQAIHDKRADAGVVNALYGGSRESDYSLRSAGIIFNPYDQYFTVMKGKNTDLLVLLDRYITQWHADKYSRYYVSREKWLIGNTEHLEFLPLWMWRAAYSVGIVLFIGLVFIIVLNRRVRRNSAVTANSEEKYRTLFETSKQGIIIADTRTTQFVQVNPAICDMLGYNENELLKLKLPDIHPVDKLNEIGLLFEKMATNVIHSALTVPLVRKDGSIRFADITSSFISLNNHINLVGFFNDIIERVEAEKIVQKKIQELEYYNKLMIDREKKMIELKQEINKLCVQTGLPQRYDLGFAKEILEDEDSERDTHKA